MTILTFKVADEEARSLRLAARKAKLTLSQFLRRQLRMKTVKPNLVGRIRCPHTGAMIFAPASGCPPLTTEAVKEMLANFP